MIDHQSPTPSEIQLGVQPMNQKTFDLYTRTNQMIIDSGIFAISLAVAFSLGSDGWSGGSELKKFLFWAAFVIPVRQWCHWSRGIYRQIWRFVSFSDAVQIGESIAIPSLIFVSIRLLYPAGAPFSQLLRIPISVIALEGLCSFTLSMAARALRRVLYVNQRKHLVESSPDSRRVLIYGAGRAGIMLKRELEAGTAYDLVGFVDDDPKKLGAMVEGTSVLGGGKTLERLVERFGIKEVLICMATASEEAHSRVSSMCRDAKVPWRVIPSAKELLMEKSVASPFSPHPNSELESSNHSPTPAPGRFRSESGQFRKPGVLVIGGAGYIGSTLVRQLLAKHYRVRVLDSLIYGDVAIRELLAKPEFELIQGDSRDLESVVRSYRDIGAVIHLGAIVGDAACALEPPRTVEINLTATKMITDVCKGYGVSRLLFASTCSVYGASDHVVNEKSEPNPISLYASTKLDSEGIILDAASSDFHPTVLRLATAFGASHRLRFDLVVNLLAIKALTERAITVHGGEQWRPFIHVHDISRAFILALETDPQKVTGQIFNAGADELTFTIAQLANLICEYVPGVRVDVAPEGDKRNYRVSFDKIRERLGFSCEKDIEFAVNEFKELHYGGIIGDYRDSKYSNHEFLRTRLLTEKDLSARIPLPIVATLRSLESVGALGDSRVRG